MAASIHSIPLPPASGTGLDDSLTWDQSIADIPSLHRDEELTEIGIRNSLTFHAVAHGRSVVGMSASLPDDETDIIKWQQTKFDSEVVAISSNSDGSVIAAATKSHVSLIKGGDGSILATRQIFSHKSRNSSSLPGVMFVSRPQNLSVPDVLVVFSDNGRSNIILISKIDGPTLNLPDLKRVREAAQDMSIDALALPHSMHVSSVSGVYVNEDTIRFFLAGNGKIVVYDYSIYEKKTTVVVDDLSELILGEWRYNDSVEMCIDGTSEMGTYMVFAACNESGQSKICWLNILDLALKAHYLCQSEVNSLKVVRSCNAEKCVAAVCATKDTSPAILVVQSLINRDGKSLKDSDSMVLFTINTISRVHTVELAAPSSLDKGPYAFRFVSKHRGDEDTLAEFVSGEQGRAGLVHFLLANNSFDKAYECITELDQHSCNTLISSPVHKSLVALWQFRYVLSKGNISSQENAVEAQLCLRRLASSAISSGDRGVQGMVDAAKFLLSWPENVAANGESASDFKKISIKEVCMALSAMSTTIARVIGALSSSNAVKLEEAMKRLDDRQTALRGLRGIAELDGLQLTLLDPYLAIGSLADLINALVSQGAFKSVERLMKSEMGKAIPSGIMASSVLRVPFGADPQCYLPWLCNLVLPTLSIGNPLLESIRSWACSAADKYDEENAVRGIDYAITLLQAVSKATARLTVAMNKSFAHKPQLDTDSHGADKPETPKHNGSFFSSFDSTTSLRSVHARPTVLNVGMISGMKTKGDRVFSAKRIGRPLALSPISPDASFLSSSSVADSTIEVDEELGYDCVEDKLQDAMRLKTARSLGMERKSLTLSNYSSKGEQYIVKELVKASLKRSVARGDDYKELVDTVRAYTSEVNADFDIAVHQYAIELCDSSRENIPTILQQTEMLSRWCSSPAVRCLIVLKMLRKALASIQKPPDLSKLASEALGLVTDENVRSELEEAIRLLSIDSLVRKYCGNGAQTFFRVNEATHIICLIQHVCRHIDAGSVLTDILVLCDAFNASVSKLDTCVSLLQRVMNACPRTIDGHELSRTDHAAAFMQELYSKDCALAARVGERMVAFCAEVLEDCNGHVDQNLFTSEAKQQALIASSTACSILSIMEDNANQVRQLDRVNMNVPTTLKKFQRIAELQAGCNIFLTLAEIQDASSCVSILVDLMKPCVNLLQQRSFKLEDGSLREKLKPMMASAKHWCAILCDTPAQVSEIWSRAVGTAACNIAKTAESHASLLLLEVSGVLDERSGHTSIHSVISVALTLCGRAHAEASIMSNSMPLISKGEGDLSAALLAMKSMAQASLLLREHIVPFSQPFMLPSSISLSGLTEFVCEVLCKSDLGTGEKLEKYVSLLQAGSRKHRQQLKRSTKVMSNKTRLPTAPVLHPTWYIGDGLLLRPVDTLLLSMASCEMILDFESNKSSTYSLMKASDIIHVLESRGAHSTSLRLIALLLSNSVSSLPFSKSVSLSNSVSSLPFSETTVENITAILAERSLGGIESGLTSGTIDSLLSISFLLHMPKEKAFTIYKSALPSAISKQDFPRILTLASIGASCGLGRFSSGEPYPWQKQIKFIDQCKSFIANAKIWSILSRYRVAFDTTVFIQASDFSSVSLQGYCEQLTWNAAKRLDPKTTLLLAKNFAKQYGVNKYTPVSALIEFLLSTPSDQLGTEVEKTDIRWDLLAVEKSVREVCLPMLPIINQSKVLRKAVMSLEQSSGKFGTDYDRHTMVLSLYKESIDKLAGFMTSESRQKAHEQESGRIHRRLNALIVLSSIFDDKYPPEKKPDYTKLFEPLPSDPSVLSAANQTKCNLLGNDTSLHDVFDPLSSLHRVLREDRTYGMASLLSPLCSLLGLPSGYIYARALVVHFSKLQDIGEALPPADSAVFPVVKKLAAPSDRAELSWWCSLQYENGSSEQLKCMDLAYNNATLASEQVELKGEGINTEEERNAIDKVKQIDLARAMLSDQIIVNEVITRNGSTSAMVRAVYKDIIQRVQDSLRTADDYMPEKLVKELLVEGSMAAAEASLDDNGTFTTSHFRSLAILVHDACRLLSARYSHINVGRCARIVTRRWLVHGDEFNSGSAADARAEASKDNQHCPENIQVPKSSSTDGDEVTTEFIMDIGSMNISSGDHMWNGHSSSYEKESGIKSTDEPSIFNPKSSQRELSDLHISRVALRISFLICFAEDYHQQDFEELLEDEHDENTDANIVRATRAKLHKGTRHKANCFEGDLALAHAKELLGIVFARQGCTVASTFAFMTDDSHDGSSMHEEDVRASSKALSFAMRYRAVRVASILCPHDVLVRVILEQGYASDFEDDYLAKVAFGSFLAMEIESMGLSLPHSDLAQLSTMHFPSYARTLWRNHGGISSGRLGGRLHLLLVELSVNHHETVDWELLVLMLGEITRIELPRSLLLACEFTIQSKALAKAALEGRKDVLHCISGAMKKILELLSNEIRSSNSSEPLDVAICASTVDRIVSVIDNLNASEVVHFAEVLTTLAAQCREQVKLSELLFSAAVRIARHLTDASLFSKAWSAITSLQDHDLVICNYSPQILDSPPSVCMESIEGYEKTFAYFGLP